MVQPYFLNEYKCNLRTYTSKKVHFFLFWGVCVGGATFYLCVPNMLVACSHMFALIFHHVMLSNFLMCLEYLLTLSHFFWPKVFPFSPIKVNERRSNLYSYKNCFFDWPIIKIKIKILIR